MIDFASTFKFVSPETAVVFTAMTPIGELRASLPLALGVYKMSFVKGYVLSVIGNLIPVVLILYLIDPVSRYLILHSEKWKKFFEWLFERTRKKFDKKFIQYGKYALIVFVAIPLPVTGAWTGSLAAFLFGIPRKQAMVLIAVGVVCAGAIVSAIYYGAFKTLLIF